MKRQKTIEVGGKKRAYFYAGYQGIKKKAGGGSEQRREYLSLLLGKV